MSEASPSAPNVPVPEIRAQLERVLESAPLRNSKRCQSLLRFVVEAALEGRLDDVK